MYPSAFLTWGIKSHRADSCHLTSVKEYFISQTYQTKDAGGTTGRGHYCGQLLVFNPQYLVLEATVLHARSLHTATHFFTHRVFWHKQLSTEEFAVRCREEDGASGLLLDRYTEAKERCATSADFIDWIGDKTGYDCVKYGVVPDLIMTTIITS